ncbi:MAG: hypothetical protein COB30_004155 [Ectothiorhodospiraceae bacterium]|nr:hypothetical protein [Ectothiorhodospiraceae bacterium]
MRMTLDMPRVSGCDNAECAYNNDLQCHARAVTLSSGVIALCETCHVAPRHVRNVQRIAGVGSCKNANCRHNEDYECIRDEMYVANIDGQFGCHSFSPHTELMENPLENLEPAPSR